MFLLHVRIEPVRYFIKVILSYTANKAVGLHVLFDTFKLITKLTKGVDNQTCNSQNYKYYTCTNNTESQSTYPEW